MTDRRFEVRHRPEESRYVLVDRGAASPAEQDNGGESYADADTAIGVQRVLFHTSVSEDYSGQGLASVPVREAVDDTVAQGYAIVPVCARRRGARQGQEAVLAPVRPALTGGVHDGTAVDTASRPEITVHLFGHRPLCLCSATDRCAPVRLQIAAPLFDYRSK